MHDCSINDMQLVENVCITSICCRNNDKATHMKTSMVSGAYDTSRLYVFDVQPVVSKLQVVRRYVGPWAKSVGTGVVTTATLCY